MQISCNSPLPIQSRCARRSAHLASWPMPPVRGNSQWANGLRGTFVPDLGGRTDQAGAVQLRTTAPTRRSAPRRSACRARALNADSSPHGRWAGRPPRMRWPPPFGAGVGVLLRRASPPAHVRAPTRRESVGASSQRRGSSVSPDNELRPREQRGLWLAGFVTVAVAGGETALASCAGSVGEALYQPTRLAEPPPKR